MKKLDLQLLEYKSELVDLVGIETDFVEMVATKISSEIKSLNIERLNELKNSSPVDLNDRYEELISFQSMMDFFNSQKLAPQMVRAQILAQNYICFVYLKDNYFRALENILPFNSVGQRCFKYLLSSDVKNLRNAIAHGNWSYSTDFNGLNYWYTRKNGNENYYQKYFVTEKMYDFWQRLSRVVAYSSMLTILNIGS